LPLKISAVMKDPDLLSLRSGLDVLGGDSPALSVFQTDLEALQTIYMQGCPDLLVIDLDLPSVIGMETVKAMRQQGDLANIPIILVSSKDLGIGPGVLPRTIFLVKPVLTDAWKDAVKRSISGETADAPRPSADKDAAKIPPAAPPSDRGDTRKAPRQRWQAPCIVGTQTKKLKGVIRDISATGARIAAETSFPVRSVVFLTFAPPEGGGFKVMQMKARLVRLTKDGYGVQFLEMDGPTRFFINKLTGQQSI